MLQIYFHIGLLYKHVTNPIQTSTGTAGLPRVGTVHPKASTTTEHITNKYLYDLWGSHSVEYEDYVRFDALTVLNIKITVF